VLQLPAAPHPKAGSGAGSQSLACFFPVNLFPAERPLRGLRTTGTAVCCPDTTACTGHGASANPAVVTKRVQPPLVLGSDSLGPRQHPQIQGDLAPMHTRSTFNAAGGEEGQKMRRTSAP